ncbi:hypothetical protein BU23DRAFT_630268 [Bimuria novae-zelandiae CBS 107.79]|uniref:SCP domain-containing protein n=1 Tax=Bimuria novae-zelandiae CBS 107.79 TaxID=1447943 RepID=A0A6A5VHA9_9PLEO|nr:hypothetical protein BU23DRAFT_630268 [Bimuria novae-zelandiae CBS 107.79]
MVCFKLLAPLLAITTFTTFTSAAPAAAANVPRQTPAYMSTVNKWRANLGLSALAYSTQLEANARQTAADGHGTVRPHLISPSRAQVLAPGNMGNFKNIFVGGWLCERPNMTGINRICRRAGAG